MKIFWILYSIFVLFLYIFYYITKRILFMIIYPISYIFKNKLEVIRESYNYYLDWEKNRDIKSKLKDKNKILLFLWFALDDAPYFSKNEEYYENKCPSWLKSDFLKAFYWGAIRNNAVNLSRFLSSGKEISKNIIFNNKKIYFVIRKFNFFIKYLPFFEIWFTERKKLKIGWKSYDVFSFRLNLHV